MINVPKAIEFKDDELYLLDQRLLPQQQEYLKPDTPEALWQAIHQLSVRGAPAIGVAAAYGFARLMRDVNSKDFRQQARSQGAYLKTSRPTAVNLAWAVDRMLQIVDTTPTYAALKAEAIRIHNEDIEMCEGMGTHGMGLIKPGSRVLTHCNAGSLATSHLGTATAPMYKAHAAGVRFKVYADETRPLYQGARLTAWELDQAGIDVTLICDNMAATLMAAREIDLVIVGTDRVTRNGDVVNKIGTLAVAVLCHHYAIPFYVACPSSTFDRTTAQGSDVTIEQRQADEVIGTHAANVPVFNAAFDVTPAALVTGIVTESGIATAPLEQTLPQLLG